MTNQVDSSSIARRSKRRLPRLALGFLICAALLLIAGELFARFWMGLGDPPLVQRDPEIKYVFKPDQICHRFGHLIKYNHYSMRSEDFPAHKADPNELRIMMIGNSIINGGALTDQTEIASEMLRKDLSDELKRPVVVGNISAGGWGPPNELAYLKRYGLFDADVLVIVCTSHDYANVPSFELLGVDPSLPETKPPLALWEGFSRYLLPKLRSRVVPKEGYVPKTSINQADAETCARAIHDMVGMARRSGAKVIMAHQPDRDETADTPPEGAEALKQAAKREGMPLIEFGPSFAAARRGGTEVYADFIHPNAAGQRVMLGLLKPAIQEVLRELVSRHRRSGRKPVSF